MSRPSTVLLAAVLLLSLLAPLAAPRPAEAHSCSHAANLPAVYSGGIEGRGWVSCPNHEHQLVGKLQWRDPATGVWTTVASVSTVRTGGTWGWSAWRTTCSASKASNWRSVVGSGGAFVYSGWVLAYRRPC